MKKLLMVFLVVVAVVISVSLTPTSSKSEEITHSTWSDFRRDDNYLLELY